MMMIALVVCLTSCHRQPEISAELWLGGDVNLGDGGRGKLKDIASRILRRSEFKVNVLADGSSSR